MIMKITLVSILLISVCVVYGAENSSTTSKPTVDSTPHTPKTYKVVTILNEPYMSLRKDQSLIGNERFEGFSKDILDKVSKLAKFDYSIHVPRDSVHGLFSGLIDDLENKRADIAAADLTVSPKRLEVADFTVPLMSAGITAVYLKRSAEYGGYKVNRLLIVSPFTVGVWMMLFLTIGACIAVLYVIGRVNPYEWRKAAEHGLIPPEEGDNLTRGRLVMFLLGAISLQGYRKVPRSAAGRLVTVFWWVFCLFIVLSYTASLMVQFLERSKEFSEPRIITDFDELVTDDNFRFVAVANHSTTSFFKNAAMPPYNTIWRRLNSKGSLVSSVEEAIKLIHTSGGKYVLLTQSNRAEYLTKQPPCDLDILVKPMHNTYHAFALTKNSPILKRVNKAMLELYQQGEYENSYRKWFRQHCAANVSPEAAKGFFLLEPYSKQPVGLADLEIAFIFIFGGLFIASAVCAIELVYYRRYKNTARMIQREEEWARGGNQELRVTSDNSFTDEVPDSPH